MFQRHNYRLISGKTACHRKGHETWPNTDAWKQGGGSTWVTGSYDPEQNLIIWGVGNPSPDWNADVRPGDNLYTDSAVALDANTGTLKWHFQFVPHDSNDWDAVQVPVLVDAEWQGRPRKLVYWAHRDGLFYVLDRTTGEFLLGKENKGFYLKGEPKSTKPWSGVMTTSTHLLFGSNGGWLSREREDMEAYFFALDADTGKELWRINLGGTMAANPITYMVNGKQMVTMAAGGAFALP